MDVEFISSKNIKEITNETRNKMEKKNCMTMENIA